MRREHGTFQLSPSDLSTHIACAHATALGVAVALNERPRVFTPDNEYLELIRRKGEEHEQAYLDRLRAEGRQVVEIDEPRAVGWPEAARQTREAMEVGAHVIYQAAFVRDRWRGLADFVERVEGPSDLGGWSYEAVDTKLARVEMKPSHVLQLAFYSAGIADVQGCLPEWMHLVLGTGEKERLRVREFAAYRRLAARRLELAVDERPATEAFPNEYCPLCTFTQVCRDEWRGADHLTYVANIRRDQIDRLVTAEVRTLTGLAGLAPGTAIPDLADDSVATLHEQARLQRETIERGSIQWTRRPEAEARGFARLPRPSAGDVMFDIEGDPFWSAACGLTFLFGLLLREGDDWRYEPVWAHAEDEERGAFERVIDRIHERLAEHPDMHVFHYSPADPADFKRLMGRYATREDDVDDLLRRGVLVDLLTVVRQGLVVGEESYGLKTVEQVAGYRRPDDGMGKGSEAVLAYERWVHNPDLQDELDGIARYNEADCRATAAVYDWLLSIRTPSTPWLEPKSRREVTAEREAELATVGELGLRLTTGQPETSVEWLAGQLLSYHRREAKPQWWRYFSLLDMTDDDLLHDAEAIAGLVPTGERYEHKQSYVYGLSFPVQELKLKPGQDVLDAATTAGFHVHALDADHGVIHVGRGKKRDGEPLPRALIPGGPIPTTQHERALQRLAAAIDADAVEYRALRDLLGCEGPRFAGVEHGAPVQTTELARQRELALTLDMSTLVIQGPPGTGKTWTGARLITELLRTGRRVGVTAFSHKAIDNLLAEVERAAHAEGLSFNGARKTGPEGTGVPGAVHIEHVDDHAQLVAGDYQLVASTTWTFVRPDWDGELDVLVIDEAGQLSLADALAAGTSAHNLILLGDPLQLPHVSQGTHPRDTGASVLEHVLGDDATVPPERGLLLDMTWRMHPNVCDFISNEIYESRLRSRPECANQDTSVGTGIRYLSVEHFGRSSSSPEEAEVVAAEIARLLDGGTWTDVKGDVHRLTESDLMVVAPYNAQVRVLRSKLPPGVPVGTVDKFQGQEAPIVFFSMATSSGEDLPRDVAFLFSRNRLNVAISRARCLAYVVCAPALLAARARTVEQMRLISTLCALVEEADRQAPR